MVRKVPELNALSSPEAVEFEKQREQKAAVEIEPVFQKAVTILREAGSPPANILTRVIMGAASRAGTIIEEARAGGYGAIVVGRRGLSTIEEFDMGQVSNKLVQLAKDKALWVAG